MSSKPAPEIGKQRFYKTVLQVTILTENGPIPDNLPLDEIVRDGIDGDSSLTWNVTSSEPVTALEMYDLLLSQHSDPEFFELEEPSLLERLAHAHNNKE